MKVLLSTLGISLLLFLNPIFAAVSSEDPVYQFLHRERKIHFYTASESEKDFVLTDLSPVWQYEGIVYPTASVVADPDGKTDLVPVYRFLHKTGKHHFYTADEGEKTFVTNFLSGAWEYEGISFYAWENSDQGGSPVHRFLHKTEKVHFYTASENEKNSVISNLSSVWEYEGIVYYSGDVSLLSWPEQVSYNCPIQTQNCVPCVMGEDSKCRAVSGDSTGYQGWACQNNNIGNIRSGSASSISFRNSIITTEGGEAACGERGGYMVFRDYTIGRESLRAYIRGIANGRHGSYLPECQDGACNLKEFFGIYAPAGDQNNPTSYANNVASRISVDANSTSLQWIIDNRFNEFIDAIQIQEGFFTQ